MVRKSAMRIDAPEDFPPFEVRDVRMPASVVIF
jgi:hypothetical protein